MTTIVSEVVIRRPAAAVFDYVTTPAHWLVWHPSSVALHGATDHSLAIGEDVTEDFQVAGHTGSVTWKVIARELPGRWAMAGAVAAGGRGTITFTLRDIPEGTAFRLEFAYAISNWFGAVLEVLFVRRHIAAESATALSRLKQALEST